MNIVCFIVMIETSGLTLPVQIHKYQLKMPYFTYYLLYIRHNFLLVLSLSLGRFSILPRKISKKTKMLCPNSPIKYQFIFFVCGRVRVCRVGGLLFPLVLIQDLWMYMWVCDREKTNKNFKIFYYTKELDHRKFNENGYT